MDKLTKSCQKIIEISYYLLFFSIPLVFSSKNYELFEYNKMMLTYAFTIVIGSCWLLIMTANKQLEIKKTPFDKFLVLFLISQVLSTIFSIDTHVSIFGYYSRFHQGLLATISYVILYFAFTTNFPKEKIKNLLYTSLVSSLIVSVWGIFEHFGKSPSCLLITHEFNVDCWVQDVQTRVFATLGQPNWMSAYLAILIPTSIGLGLTNLIKKQDKLTGKALLFFLTSIVFYASFLFTRSRSGFAALWISLTLLVVYVIIRKNNSKVKPLGKVSKSKKLVQETKIDFLDNQKTSLKLAVIILGILTFFLGSGISQIDKLSFDGIKEKFSPPASSVEKTAPKSEGPALETGGTESGVIRAIVWQGALDIFKHYPIFGSGVETFAFSYYQFRPASHNMVSEWDFLYNKAHNEYLNFLATTGIVGFISYLSFIAGFVIWIVFKIKKRELSLLDLSLFAGWLTILITNFFGFSVVIIALFFYLIPALIFVLNETKPSSYRLSLKNLDALIILKPISAVAVVFKSKSIIPIAMIVLLGTILLYKLNSFYQADIDYARANSLAQNDNYQEAFLFMTQAIAKNPFEPLYHDEMSSTLATLAAGFASQKDEESAKKFAALALKESDIATSISPNNVSFYKTKAKVNYSLSTIDPSFVARAISSLETAEKLAPTDPKIKYNIAILQSKMNNIKEAINMLQVALNLKPNYKDARYALALLYKDNGDTQKGVEQLNYILKNIDPSDQDSKDKLKAWQ